MGYGLAADVVLLVHFAFVIAVVCGGLAWLRWRFAPVIHLPIAAWGMAVELASWPCPLTAWENALLRAAGESGYEGGFVGHYLLAVLYPGDLTRQSQIVLGLAVLGVNALIYTWVWRRRTAQH